MATRLPFDDEKFRDLITERPFYVAETLDIILTKTTTEECVQEIFDILKSKFGITYQLFKASKASSETDQKIICMFQNAEH